MASGHVNRTQRPNTWLHRPSLRREDSPCQLGAVHTGPKACALSQRENALPVATGARASRRRHRDRGLTLRWTREAGLGRSTVPPEAVPGEKH